MPDFEVTSPDGVKFRITAPEGATPEQALAYAQQQFSKPSGSAQYAAPQLPKEQPGLFSRYLGSHPGATPETNNTWGQAIKNVGNAALHGATAITGGIAGDVAGLGALGAAAVGDAITGKDGGSGIDPQAVRERVQRQFTYPLESPDSAAASIVGFPGKVIGGAGEELAAKVVNPYLQHVLRAAPLALASYGGVRAARPPMMDTTALGGTGKIPVPQQQPLARISGATPEARAQAYVGSRTGLDWNGLSEAFRKHLTDIAADSNKLEGLDATAVERIGRLQSLPKPVPATRGQVTRDPVQLRNEGNVSATEAGKPIREVYVDQTKALLDNLDILKGKTSGQGKTRATAETPEQVGRSVQDGALREKAAASKRKYDFLYKKARATEPDAVVDSTALQDMLAKNPEVQHLGFMEGWLKKAGANEPGKKVRLQDLQDLREKAGGIARAGGTDGYYAGEVVRAIDGAMEQVPAAAKSWKEAQAAFKKHKTEFEEQGAVERLVTDKSRTDRATALEDTWRKTVIGGSIEDLNKVKRSLLTGGDNATRTAGRKAFRDLQAQTVQHIINEATKSVTRYEDGTPNLTPAAMERAIRSIGKDKLEQIFSPAVVKQLDNIMEATRTVKTQPPAGFVGSPTFANAIAFLEKNIGRIPGVGNMTVGAVRGAAKLNEMGQVGKEVRRATSTPLDDARSTRKPASNNGRKAVAYGATGQREQP